MSSSAKNQEWQLVERPSGLPQVKNWKLNEIPYPKLGANQILLKAKFISVDPYLRNVIGSAPLNVPTVSFTVSEVVESNNSEYKVGDIVTQTLPWQQYQAITPDPKQGLRKVDPAWGPISTAVGILGMPGQTAYFGLFEVCKFTEKDKVVLVSGAAGAVGSIVVQLAKQKGAKVIGTAGGKEKCDYVKSLGADVVIDYKEHSTLESMKAQLKAAIGSDGGIDVYYDNTGGHVTDAVWDLTSRFARVAICGQISEYNSTTPPPHPNFLMKLIYKSVTIRGFVVHEFTGQFGKFFAEMPELVKGGKIKYSESIVDGFEKVPEAFIGLFHGANTGKAVVKI